MRVSDERYAYLRAIYMDGAPADMPDHERLALIREYVTLFDDDGKRQVVTVACAACGRGAYQYGVWAPVCHACAQPVAACPCPPRHGWEAVS